MIVFGVLTALVLYGVLHFQDTVMAFLLREDSSWRILATVCVLFFVPLFAFVYGSAVNLFLSGQKAILGSVYKPFYELFIFICSLFTTFRLSRTLRLTGKAHNSLAYPSAVY